MAKNFSSALADKLLDKLSSDDAFRTAFEHNPRAALAQLGYSTPDADRDVKGVDPVMCLYNAKPLASKEKIRAARSELQTQLTAAPFKFALSGLESG